MVDGKGMDGWVVDGWLFIHLFICSTASSLWFFFLSFASSCDFFFWGFILAILTSVSFRSVLLAFHFLLIGRSFIIYLFLFSPLTLLF